MTHGEFLDLALQQWTFAISVSYKTLQIVLIFIREN